MRKILVRCICFFLVMPLLSAQAPKKLSSSEIYQALQKLNFLGSALYIAAHPDDENTRLISYLSNHVHARTAYLSITRGDGGQNLIGPELRELLGVLRTQELLAARRIDGGEQFFTRANDFGYSKHPDETLEIWDKKAVLGDVVWMIRNFRPDVVINRFDHRTPGSTHGHHTSSAILSVEAFEISNDPEAYPDQLDHTDPWRPKRLFFNTSWWFYGSRENFEKADKSRMLSLDIGVYDPLTGVSNNEIAALASSQHRCQGFGRLSVRGSQQEYLELLEGELPKDKKNLFEGIDTSWSRIKGGKEIGDLLYEVEANFDFKNPSKHLPQLVEAYEKLQAVEDQHWKKVKSKELKELIVAITGLYLEASAEYPYTNPGKNIKVAVEALNRSSGDITLKSITLNANPGVVRDTLLKENQKVTLELELEVPEGISHTSPYWLAEEGSLGMYRVRDQKLIGKPETPRAFHASFQLEINNTQVTIERPVVHRYSKPERGELYRPFEILPEATAGFSDKVLIFDGNAPRQVAVTVRAHKDELKGTVSLSLPEGWSVRETEIPVEISNKDEEKTLTFTLSPPEYEDEGKIIPLVKIDEKTYSKALATIDYDHIPVQSVLLPSAAKVVRLDIQKVGEHIGYIMGAGDQVPESLEQIGYTVHPIDPNSIQPGSLSKYDAVVVGIRAYNVVPKLKFKQNLLFEYVKGGGNLILQYNTAGRWEAPYEDIAPYPLKLSSDRVTEENSAVEVVAKDHALVNFPNPISKEDFEGWVQERGLYFPNQWDAAFTPILSMNDKNENPKQGGLLVAPYGKGNYIYTGLSFFRELPAGVPGAYKLFANMLSLGKEKVEKESAIKG